MYFYNCIVYKDFLFPDIYLIQANQMSQCKKAAHILYTLHTYIYIKKCLKKSLIIYSKINWL